MGVTVPDFLRLGEIVVTTAVDEQIGGIAPEDRVGDELPEALGKLARVRSRVKFEVSRQRLANEYLKRITNEREYHRPVVDGIRLVEFKEIIVTKVRDERAGKRVVAPVLRPIVPPG